VDVINGWPLNYESISKQTFTDMSKSK